MVSTPKPPDPFKTAQAQTQSNQSTAISQQLLNMIDQVTPYGNLNYTQNGTRTYFDPSLNKNVDLPSFMATTTLSPEQQALFGQQQEFDKKLNGLALNQADAVTNTLSKPFQYNAGEHEAWASNLYDKINGDYVQKQQGSMEQKLANQGLQPGTAAYDDAMRNLTYSQDKARNDFELNSYNTGYQSARDQYTLPINVATSLMNGQQVQNPTFASTPQTGVNGTDIAGLINQNYQQRLQNAQAQNAGIMGLGSTILGGMFSLSDERTKTNKKKIGKLNDGTGLYRYEYKPEFGGAKGVMHVGVMAQEAEKKHPNAVMMGADGYRRVNYDRIAQELAS